MLPFGAENIQEFVEKWNRQIPIDKWYRHRYNIPFNSPQHRAVSLADMYFDFFEFVLDKFKKKEDEKKGDKYVRGKGNFMKEAVYTEADIDRLFEELDLNEIDKQWQKKKE